MDIEIQTPRGTLIALDRFNYTKQAGDVADVEGSLTNHTNVFSVRNDNESVRVLRGLGLVGSTSQVPYQKTFARLIVDNFEIIENGRLHVQGSDKDKFKLAIYDGNVDFWKRLEGLTLEDIDLSETIHDKKAATIVASFSNDYYKYILGDYGGKTTGDPHEWNGDFLIPSINEQYIFDRIFEHIGMTAQLSVDVDTWLTYPKDTYDEFGYEESVKALFNGVANNVQAGDFIDIPPVVTQSANMTWYANAYTGTVDVSGWYKIGRSGGLITTKLIFHKYLHTPFGSFIIDTYIVNGLAYISLYVNGEFRHHFQYQNGAIDIKLEEGDIIELKIGYNPDPTMYNAVPSNTELAYAETVTAFSVEMLFERHNFIGISFGSAFKDISAKDFIKYIMMRYGLTLFVEGSEAIFLTMQERLDADAVDLSEYVKRKIEESYVYPNYAAKNTLRHKYVEETDNSHDGYVYANENVLQDEKILFESFVFAPTPEYQMPVFETEVKDNNGVVEISYKSILGRFFSIKYEDKTLDDDIGVFTEQIPAMETHQGAAPFVNFTETTFRQYVPEYWRPIERLISEAKIIKFELDLSMARFKKLDLKQKVYLEQENAYFLINRAVMKGLKTVEIELVKIK